MRSHGVGVLTVGVVPSAVRSRRRRTVFILETRGVINWELAPTLFFSALEIAKRFSQDALQ